MFKNSKNCKNLKSYQISIPIGLIDVTSCEKGLHSLNFNKFKPDYATDIKILNDSDQVKPVIELYEFLINYFSKTPLKSSIPSLCWKEICKPDSFTEKILKILLTQIKFGSQISYKELATLSGNSNSQRAVGTVMRKNPICLLIPCHRVIKSDRTMGNYSGGVEIKEWLLDFEADKSNK